jgi:uncharacterized Tic20 family protein
MKQPEPSQQPNPDDESRRAESAGLPEVGESDETPHAETSHEARNMAMLCHLLGLLGFLAPLVIWLSERDKHKFVDEHGREAMNYQVSLMIYVLIAVALCFVRVGLYILWGLIAVHILLVVIGTAKAAGGRSWRYPIAFRFLR